jgi:hypothetical protein
LKTNLPSDYITNCDIIKDEIIKAVEITIGKFARPKQIKFVCDLPKTRTGKLVRRLIRAKISNSIEEQDLTMIENPASLDNFYYELHDILEKRILSDSRYLFIVH